MELLGAWITGARVLELYAGTGAVGLEALSRGAASVDFVENGPSALHSLKANIAALRAGRRARVFKQDALRFIARLPAAAYDIALADPPYGSGQTDRIVARWRAVPFARALAIEHAADHPLAGGRTRIIGDAALTLYESGRPARKR